MATTSIPYQEPINMERQLPVQLNLDLRLPPEYEAFLAGMRTNSTHTPTYESNQLREFHLRTQQEK